MCLLKPLGNNLAFVQKQPAVKKKSKKINKQADQNWKAIARFFTHILGTLGCLPIWKFWSIFWKCFNEEFKKLKEVLKKTLKTVTINIASILSSHFLYVCHTYSSASKIEHYSWKLPAGAKRTHTLRTETLKTEIVITRKTILYNKQFKLSAINLTEVLSRKIPWKEATFPTEIT